jgi:microtubule-associated protein-like 6
LLFWDITTGQQVPDGATRYRDEIWHKWTAKLGWPVQGIYGGQVDFTHVNTVDRSGDKAVFAVGNDWGLVELFGNPNNKGAKSNAYRAHSEHVTSVKWSCDDRYLFSAGGYDNCVMQWRKG